MDPSIPAALGPIVIGLLLGQARRQAYRGAVRWQEAVAEPDKLKHFASARRHARD